MASMDLSDESFKKFRELAYQHAGITVGEGKKSLLKNRLGSIARKYKLNYEELYLQVKSGKDSELVKEFVDKITTHETYFFRESKHFDFLKDKLYPEKRNQRLKFWSAACSTGEEPWSLSMHLFEHHSPKLYSVFATDISEPCVDHAKLAEYGDFRLREVPVPQRSKYFDELPHLLHGKKGFKPHAKFGENLGFGTHNLMKLPPLSWGPFDVIFLRNVLIYFDLPTQSKIILNITSRLNKGGYLVIGHSESIRDTSLPLKLIEPTIYQKGE